ncbi:alkaline ceramidase [Pseudoalteromonas rubra]|uniref:Neutral ceramidase n=2 Tax=Pseudoalteromonas rubra TaxID=43658 RepID=A0A5S3X2S6_9GAMM|nr:alkaline ceramidase [Pseudoalteromonas rubra]
MNENSRTAWYGWGISMTTLHARYKTWLIRVSSLALVLVSLGTKANSDWIVGSGIYDITGPAADRGMVGYGDVGQTTKGIHTRLWSRAFVIGKPNSNQLVTFVSADLQSITQGVHQGVLKKIASDPIIAPFFNQNNVMLSATHVHVGPGGYDHNIMLNMSALGYDEDNYNTIVNGIYLSIRNAYLSRGLGSIHINQGQLSGAAVNRNLTAYNQNPDADEYDTQVNETMTLLKLVKSNGQEIGMINWFGVHNVSSNQSQRLITGDNKGVAAQLFEKQKGANWPLSGQFVAAFANSEEGDVSPNVCGPENGCAGSNEANVTLSANKQYNKALSLYNNATDTLSGALDVRFQYVKLPGLTISGHYTGNGAQSLCEGAIGFSMTAGATYDGPSGQSGVFEGMTQDNEGTSWDRSTVIGAVGGAFKFINDFAGLLGFDKNVLGSKTHEVCQYPKPTFLPTQLGAGAHLYTDTLPFQLFQIGNMALVGIPGEMTTMAARRLRSDLQTALAPRGITTVVFAGLANAYGGYITTKEEYQIQYYEGAHTLFGQHSLAAYRQIFSELANALVNGDALDTGPSPLDWSNKQKVYAIGVVYDDKRLWESFGQTWNDANSSYMRGNTVKVKFRSGHPQNNFKTMSSFMEVQRYENGSWSTVLTDNDLSTKFTWTRDTAADCMACSFAQLEWTIDAAMPTGTYRIKHNGHWKSGWGGKIKSYSGKSRTFTVK